MNELLNYIINVFKKVESGDLPSHPDPADPADLEDPLTEEDIQFIKRLRKEMTRFESDEIPPH